MTLRWIPNPKITPSDHYVVYDLLVDENENIYASVEQFYNDGPTYANALNIKAGGWERSGAMTDPVEAMLWCERLAGMHPLKAGDTMAERSALIQRYLDEQKRKRRN